MEDIYLVEKICKIRKGFERFINYETIGAFSSLAEIKKSFSSLITLMERNGFKPKFDPGLDEELFYFVPDDTAPCDTIGYKVSKGPSNDIIEKMRLHMNSCSDLVPDPNTNLDWKSYSDLDLDAEATNFCCRIRKLKINTVRKCQASN
jgi:hypothetical protein